MIRALTIPAALLAAVCVAATTTLLGIIRRLELGKKR